jgi:hypothetical protein
MESAAPTTGEARFVIARVRAAEWVVGVAGLALALDLFLVPWYGSSTGWGTLLGLRYLVLLCAVGGVAVLWLQGSLGAPALPVSATTIQMLVAGLAFAGLLARLVLGPPGSVSGEPVRGGLYIGLALSAAIAAGAYRSLRRDGIREEDGPGEIELLSVPQTTDG